MKRFVFFGIASIASLFVVINVFMYLATRGYIYDVMSEVPKADAVLIPGAAVRSDGELSPIFKDRVDTALELYETGRVKKFLVSGDNSTETYNEVNPVRVYLLSKNIKDEDIFLDHAGFDTYSTMYRAREIFEVQSVIISTQSFHLPRSIYIARVLDIEAYGINADEGNILLRNYVRESLANVKAISELVIHRKPKYLGEKIPITGDGSMSR